MFFGKMASLKLSVMPVGAGRRWFASWKIPRAVMKPPGTAKITPSHTMGRGVEADRACEVLPGPFD